MCKTSTNGGVVKKKKRPIILSVSIIAGNEENWIGKIIDDCKYFADEIVVLCSGIDNTKNIAAQNGCRVYDWTWNKNFSDARNECLKHCNGRYVLWVDCDDRIIPSQQRQINMLKHTWLKKPQDIFFKCMLADRKGNNSQAHSMTQTRIFPKLSDKMWEGTVHESVVQYASRRGDVSRETDIWVYHEGYQDPELLSAKIKRNVELLEQDVEKYNDPIKKSYLGASLSNTGNKKEALRVMANAYEQFEKSPHKPTKFTYLMRMYPILYAGKNWKALVGAMKQAIDLYPTDPQPHLVLARVAAVTGQFEEALKIIEKGKTMEYVEDAGLPVIGDVREDFDKLQRVCEKELLAEKAESLDKEIVALTKAA